MKEVDHHKEMLAKRQPRDFIIVIKDWVSHSFKFVFSLQLLIAYKLLRFRGDFKWWCEVPHFKNLHTRIVTCSNFYGLKFQSTVTLRKDDILMSHIYKPPVHVVIL